MKNVDLVIAADTAVAHLAGALGVRVWVLMRYAADWRWMLDRDDSPWYPTMRLFRQPEPENWSAVFRAVARLLSVIVAPGQRPVEGGIQEPGSAAISNRQAAYLARILRLLGKGLTKQGRVQDGVSCMLDAVQIEPDQSEDHAALGLAYLQLEQPLEAVSHLERSLSLRPGQADVHCNLGIASFRLESIREAALNYRAALRLQPNHVDALHNMGNLQRVTGHLDPAIATLQAAVRLRPDAAASYLLLGKAFAQKGDANQAIVAFRRATALNPKLADAHVGLGSALAETKQWEEAVTVLRQAVRLAPADGDAHFQLGNSLRAIGRPAEAIACYRTAIDLLPEKAACWNNLGTTFLVVDRFEEAETAYRQMLAEQPNSADAWTGLGIALKNQSRFDEAHTCFAQALRADPNHVEAHLSRGLTWLLQGDLRRGWPEYEWRAAWRGPAAAAVPRNRWDGSPLTGRTILLIPEQGLGDTIQFIRYVPLLKAQGARIVLLCPPSLRALMQPIHGIDHLADPDQPLPPFDVVAPLLSLPVSSGLSWNRSPLPFLIYLPIRRWWSAGRRSSTATPDHEIGLVWQGNPRHAMTGFRYRCETSSRWEGLKACGCSACRSVRGMISCVNYVIHFPSLTLEACSIREAWLILQQ